MSYRYATYPNNEKEYFDERLNLKFQNRQQHGVFEKFYYYQLTQSYLPL